MKRLLLLIITTALLTGCGSTKHIQTVPVETIKEVTKTDTLYINNVQYDSIYISQDKHTDRSRDTILIKETNTEYRYKFLRDTIERVKIEAIRDSIPYEIKKVETKEIPRKRNILDYISYACFGLTIGCVLTRLNLYFK